MAHLTNEDKILTKNSPDLNPVVYSAWGRCNRWRIVTKFQTLTSWNACLTANRLLGSAKPGVRHVKSSDRSTAKKTDDDYQGQGRPC